MSKILVIDDDALVRATIVTMLEDAGHEAICAADGESGLRVIVDDGVELVVLDVWMPEVDGITVLKTIRANHPELPTIIMSGGGPKAPLEHSTALADTYGAADVLFKPFDSDELIAAVDRALGGSG